MEAMYRCDRHEIYYKDSFCPVCTAEEEIARLRDDVVRLENILDEIGLEREIDDIKEGEL